MKGKWGNLALMAALFVLSSGCVAIPPLINVQHKDSSPDTNKKLESIERRLDQIERKLEKPAP